jgi:hypothetical protein
MACRTRRQHSFSLNGRGAPVVSVEAMNVTRKEAGEGASADDRFVQIPIAAGNVVEALQAALNKARGR